VRRVSPRKSYSFETRGPRCCVRIGTPTTPLALNLYALQDTRETCARRSPVDERCSKVGRVPRVRSRDLQAQTNQLQIALGAGSTGEALFPLENKSARGSPARAARSVAIGSLAIGSSATRSRNLRSRTRLFSALGPSWQAHSEGTTPSQRPSVAGSHALGAAGQRQADLSDDASLKRRCIRETTMHL
jgi:hypothetical protein